MGVVYVGRHETLGRRVVVKVLKTDVSRKADMVNRFFNEAQAATAINNPGIAQVFDFGTTPGGQAYFVMELLEGETLTARLRHGPLEAEDCCRLGRQIANVLQAAHEAGILHRDLKPDNLFLVRDAEVIGGERVKVLDFGLAKLANESRSIQTRTGVVMGTPSYMSPEQCRGIRNADARSDIYSLGCILFRMACGRPPFVGGGPADVVVAHVQEPAPDPRQFKLNIPDELAALISKMLAKHPDSRPQTMAAVSQAFDEIMATFDTPRARQSALLSVPPLPAPSPSVSPRPPSPPPVPPRLPPAVTSVLPRPALAVASVPPRPAPEDSSSVTDAEALPMPLDDTMLALGRPPSVLSSQAIQSPEDIATMPRFTLSPALASALAPSSASSSAASSAMAAAVVAVPPLSSEPRRLPRLRRVGLTEMSSLLRLGPRRLPFVLAGLLAAGALIAIAVVLADGGSGESEPPMSLAQLEAPASASSKTAAALVARCEALQTDRKWPELERCADELKPLDPDRAAALRTRAEQETRSASRVAAVEAALRKDNLKRAKAELEYVWAESVEHPDIKRKYVMAEAQAISDLASELARVRDSDCRKYNVLLAKARTPEAGARHGRGRPPHAVRAGEVRRRVARREGEGAARGGPDHRVVHVLRGGVRLRAGAGTGAQGVHARLPAAQRGQGEIVLEADGARGAQPGGRRLRAHRHHRGDPERALSRDRSRR